MDQASANPQGEYAYSPRGSGATVGYLGMGYPKQNIKWVAQVPSKNNKSKKVSRGPLPVVTRPTRPSSSSPRAPRRRSRHPGEAPREGLGRRGVLRIARGLPREASAGSLISVSREAAFSVSREASRTRARQGAFSVSLESGSSAVPRPPPRPTLPTAGHVPLMLSTTPVISAGQRLNVTERPTRPEVTSAPYRPGQGTAGITGHCVQTL